MALKPSFEELQGLEVAVPSFEELQKEEQGISVPEVQASVDDFGATEMTLRGAREAVKGASLGLTEPVFGASAGAEAAVLKLIKDKDFDSAQKLINEFKSGYKADLERQAKFESEYPTLTSTAQMAGGVAIPQGLAAKGVGTAIQAVEQAPTIGKFVKEAAKMGAGQSAIGTAAEQIAKMPYEGPKEPSKYAGELGESAAVGAVAGPAIGLGMGALTYGTAAASSFLESKLKKAAVSAPVRAMMQTLLGPNADVQKKWIEAEKEIRNLPDKEAVIKFFDDVRNTLENESLNTQADYDLALRNLDAAEKSLRFQSEKSEGKIKQNLQDAKNELSLLKEQLNRERDYLVEKKSAETREAKLENRIVEMELKDPSMGPHVQTVEESLDLLKDTVNDYSLEATNLLDQNFVYSRDRIIGHAEDQLKSKNLAISGTKVALTDTQQAARNRIERLIERAKELPAMLDAVQVKSILQSLDKDWQELLVGRYGEQAANAIKGIRVSIDRDLKGSNPAYAKAMEPVAERRAFLEQAVKEFSTPSQIESKLRQAQNNPRLESIFKKLKDYTGLDVVAPINEIKEVRDMRDSLRKARMSMKTPDYPRIREIEQLKSLAETKDFRQAVFDNVRDTEEGKRIIELRDLIESLTDPDYVRRTKYLDTFEQTLSEAAAQAEVEELSKKRDQLIKKTKQFLLYPKGEQALSAILRQPINSSETAEATRLIEAVSQLPDEQFEALFKSLNLQKPEQFKRMVELLRVEEGVNKPFIAGSRRTLLFKALGSAIGSAFGAGIGGIPGAAIGAITGASMDHMGPKLTKAYLKRVANMQGVPTLPKYEAASVIPFTPELRNIFKSQITSMLADIKSSDFVYVDATKAPEIVNDIKNSNLSTVEKARSIAEVTQKGGIKGSTLTKIMMQDYEEPSSKSIGAKMSEAIIQKKEQKPSSGLLEKIIKDKPADLADDEVQE